MDKNPYPYQMEILDVIDKNDRGIIKVATGGGKSLIAALIAAKLGKKTIIYVIGKDLLYQFHVIAFLSVSFKSSRLMILNSSAISLICLFSD